MVADRRSLTFHALQVRSPNGREATELPGRKRIRTRPELDTLLRFAGLPTGPDGLDVDADGFEYGGEFFIGREVTMPTHDGEVSLTMALDRRVRDAAVLIRARSSDPSSEDSLRDDVELPRTSAFQGGEPVRVEEVTSGLVVAVSSSGAALRIVSRR